MLYLKETIDDVLIPQYIKGERAWIMYGNMETEEGFSLFLIHENELMLYLPQLHEMEREQVNLSTSRVVTISEVKDLIKNPRCRNKKITSWIFRQLERWQRANKTSLPKYRLDIWRSEMPDWLTTNKWILRNQYHLFTIEMACAINGYKNKIPGLTDSCSYDRVLAALKSLSGSDEFHAKILAKRLEKEYKHIWVNN